MSEARVLPLPRVTGVYEHDSSTYPDRVKIPMSDGQIVQYRIDVEQPHPCFLAAMKNIERMEVCGRPANQRG